MTAPKDRGDFFRFTKELRQNPALQRAVALIDKKPGGNHAGLVNVARTFGFKISVLEIRAYKLGVTRTLKNAQYLGSVLG